MARKTETKEIDGLTFSITQLPYRRGRAFAFRVAGFLLPAIGKLTSEAKNLGLADGDIAALVNAGPDTVVPYSKVLPLLGHVGKALGEGAEVLFSRLSEQDLERLEKEMFEFATVQTPDGYNGALAPVADEILAGKVSTGFKFLLWAIKVNCWDFSDALAGQAGALAALGSRFLSTSKKAGTPGAS